jgi:hypothetical protein
MYTKVRTCLLRVDRNRYILTSSFRKHWSSLLQSQRLIQEITLKLVLECWWRFLNPTSTGCKYLPDGDFIDLNEKLRRLTNSIWQQHCHLHAFKLFIYRSLHTWKRKWGSRLFQNWRTRKIGYLLIHAPRLYDPQHDSSFKGLMPPHSWSEINWPVQVPWTYEPSNNKHTTALLST